MILAKKHIKLGKLTIAVLALLLVGGQAWGANCGGVTACACGDTVTSSYTLAGNLSCTNAGVALTVGANDVTLNLGGFIVDGDDTNTTVGVLVNNYTGITITNGTITDFTESGVSVEGSSTGTVSNIASNSHGNQGFQNLGTASWQYSNIIGNSNVDDGFSMHDDSVAVISTGSFTGNAQGINIIANSFLTANNITIVNSTANDLMLNSGTGGVKAIITGLYISSSPSLNSVQVDANSDSLTITNGSINNTLSGSNFSALLKAGNLLISGVLFSGSGGLGDVNFQSSGTQEIYGCTFSKTSSTPISVTAGTLSIRRNIFTGAYTNHNIDIPSGVTGNVSYNVFNSSIGSGKYAAVVRTGGAINLFNNVIYDGGGSKDGGGIYAQGTVVAKNNIFMGLSTGINLVAGTPTVDYNCFYDVTTKFIGAVTSTHEITSDPLFITNGSNFGLQSTSPVNGAGGIITGLHDQASPAKDYAGVDVTWGPSIGAYHPTGTAPTWASLNGAKLLRASQAVTISGDHSAETIDLSNAANTGALTVTCAECEIGKIIGNSAVTIKGTPGSKLKGPVEFGNDVKLSNLEIVH